MPRVREARQMKELNGKVAVVTGAGSGLGCALALACAARGMALVLADVSEPGLAQTTIQIRAAFPASRVITRPTDVSKLTEVEALAALALSQYGAAHLLFNNAGVAISAPIWEHTEDDWQWVLGVNLYGVAWGIKVFTPIMLKQGEGHIVSTASANGWMSTPTSGIYAVSKCAVVSMSETLALDIADANGNVDVSVISPAFFSTNIQNSAAHRPQELSATAPLSEIRSRREREGLYAMQHGRLSPAEIAEKTLQGIEAGHFYIFPHPGIKKIITARAMAAQNEVHPFDPLAPRDERA